MKITKRLLKPVDSYSWEGNTQESIVLHTTLGTTYKGAEDTLKIRHLSYHYVIDKDGSIYQLVDISRSAWHTGVRSNPNLRVRTFYGNDNPNRRSIGIAFVRFNESELTREQRDAAVWLIKEIGKQTGVRFNASNIFAHVEITDYKPKEVLTPYRDQVIDGLVGFKDETDVSHETNLQLYIKLLRLKVKLLRLQLAQKSN